MNLTYEEAIKKLENILKNLDDKDLNLEESIVQFKEGVDLYKYCNDLLLKAEGQVNIILEDQEGKEEEGPFPMED